MADRGAVANFAVAWALTVGIESVVLWFGLAPRHTAGTRVFAGLWLSSCTLPVVHFVFPALRGLGVSAAGWIGLAELFAPVAECLLFALVLAPGSAAAHGVIPRGERGRDFAAIVAANLASVGVGLLLARAAFLT